MSGFAFHPFSSPLGGTSQQKVKDGNDGVHDRATAHERTGDKPGLHPVKKSDCIIGNRSGIVTGEFGYWFWSNGSAETDERSRLLTLNPNQLLLDLSLISPTGSISFQRKHFGCNATHLRILGLWMLVLDSMVLSPGRNFADFVSFLLSFDLRLGSEAYKSGPFVVIFLAKKEMDLVASCKVLVWVFLSVFDCLFDIEVELISICYPTLWLTSVTRQNCTALIVSRIIMI